MKLEWYASLYVNNGRVIIPGEVMEAALVGGARKQKLGKQAQAGLFVEDDLTLDFDGSELSIDELWERDQNRLTKGVRVGSSKVMRTRFWTKQWSAIVEVLFDPGLFNQEQIVEIMRVTGFQIGICDWRPKFGRFASELAT